MSTDELGQHLLCRIKEAGARGLDYPVDGVTEAVARSLYNKGLIWAKSGRPLRLILSRYGSEHLDRGQP